MNTNELTAEELGSVTGGGEAGNEASAVPFVTTVSRRRVSFVVGGSLVVGGVAAAGAIVGLD